MQIRYSVCKPQNTGWNSFNRWLNTFFFFFTNFACVPNATTRLFLSSWELLWWVVKTLQQFDQMNKRRPNIICWFIIALYHTLKLIKVIRELYYTSTSLFDHLFFCFHFLFDISLGELKRFDRSWDEFHVRNKWLRIAVRLDPHFLFLAMGNCCTKSSNCNYMRGL